MVPLLRDARELKAWLSKKCTVDVASGDELSMYWRQMGMGGAAMPDSMPVCKSSDPTLVELSRCENPSCPGCLSTYCTWREESLGMDWGLVKTTGVALCHFRGHQTSSDTARSRPQSPDFTRGITHGFCRQVMQLMHSGVCDISTSTVTDAECMGRDSMLMMQDECMSRALPILQLNATDVRTSASAWKAVHAACGDMQDMVCTWPT